MAVFLANSYLGAREAKIDRGDLQTQRIAVAAVPLAYGAEITPDRVRFVEFPTSSLPPGTFASLEELLPEGKKRHVLRPVTTNQPLIAADLTGEGEGASIAATLPDGMRAATVRINAVSGVAGFIQPNDTVDVLITRVPIDGAESQVTDVLLQNVRVIAMDQRAQENGQPAVSSTATLEVTPVDAQKLALGQQLGSLSLVLRKPGIDENIPVVETVSLRDLRYELSRAYERGTEPAPTARPTAQRVVRRQAPRRAAATPPPQPKVEITRGTNTSTYEVGDYDQ
ncbi:pilus assembly protein CpaB [Sphingomicrobium lutaoense]|uniref:Pilus assembly protein CpaB n=1 Tax=Sphingomicrobium lutaoense TaxID=515949 RepID=A0A839Z4X5_9SPHN|nr:pilus assembly protein CpaB [Sphingomicrobium lutaoense]